MKCQKQVEINSPEIIHGTNIKRAHVRFPSFSLMDEHSFHRDIDESLQEIEMFNRTAMLALAPSAFALAAGAVLPFQAASNAAVGRALGHPLWGALTSLSVSVMAILPMLALLKVPAPAVESALRGPWWLWIGGFFGAIYVAAAASVTPKLGAGGFLVCVVAGQMLASVVVDHFGLMGLASKPASLTRVLGVALILGGVFLVQGTGAIASRPHP